MISEPRPTLVKYVPPAVESDDMQTSDGSEQGQGQAAAAPSQARYVVVNMSQTQDGTFTTTRSFPSPEDILKWFSTGTWLPRCPWKVNLTGSILFARRDNMIVVLSDKWSNLFQPTFEQRRQLLDHCFNLSTDAAGRLLSLSEESGRANHRSQDQCSWPPVFHIRRRSEQGHLTDRDQ